VVDNDRIVVFRVVKGCGSQELERIMLDLQALG
jgi:hypothetical protein